MHATVIILGEIVGGRNWGERNGSGKEAICISKNCIIKDNDNKKEKYLENKMGEQKKD